MLKNLYIKNIALVDQQNIDFDQGLNIITGETGAGKSVIMGSMRLLMGQRAEKSLIRSGEQKAEISAILEIPSEIQEKILSVLEEQEIEIEEKNELILRRVISQSNSRNFINSTPVPLQVLKQIGEQFIDIFSAGEQHSLADSSQQLSILDRFMGGTNELKNTKKAFATWKALRQKLEEMAQQFPSKGELEILRFQHNEIIEAKLKADEEATLYDQYSSAASGQERMELAQQLSYSFENEHNTGTISSLRLCLANAQDLARLDKKSGSEFAERIESLLAELCDMHMDFENYTSEIVLDPKELEYLEERMQTYNSIKRKYGTELEEVLNYLKEITEKIDLADNFDSEYSKLEEEIAQAKKSFLDNAKKLRLKRKKAAKNLAIDISTELKELEFLNSEFDIQVKDNKASSKGIDLIEFRFSPNKGEPAKLLSDIASSGEISRVMLAVKSILAKVDSIPMLIFDEIDANIGGITASKVAHKLKKLGQNRQLFCVTHLPQVAAAGDFHYLVQKSEIKQRSVSSISSLEQDEKTQEIGRMLGGESNSKLVYEHAKELQASFKK
ncbi:ATPase involved in DNA repair [Lentisphaera araneosa HTCC2155]|uniref:DNA repair protein RecN n=1 Tax=Lentisphaera araneosa HTCC2155 TaxID=313628 RepID=A6DH42_9BACT|nr:DNA repair protein RecN [Lentisphaera araneosa]EDM28925.1 ATPase involved in DNA repair [Lentisphaera araneosa HTCC2155]